MSLNDDPLINDIQDRINKRVGILSVQLAMGGASSYEHYRNTCGEIKGLKQALTLIGESINNYTNDDDD